MRGDDPKPVAYCAVCGEPILWGDPCVRTYEGDLVHSSGVYRSYKDRWTNRPLLVSCATAYILDTNSQDDIISAAGLEKKLW